MQSFLYLIIYHYFFSIFRCTLNKIPESNNLLQKSRLPLGILIHPYRDLSVSKFLVKSYHNGDVHKLRNALGGGGQRFVTNHCKDIGNCTVFCYEGGGV
jgi:hypothetical protein